MSLLVWIWLILAVIFALAELASLSFFIMPFSLGALIAFIAQLAGLPPFMQICIFLVSSLILLFFVRPFAKRVTSSSAPQKGAIDRFREAQGEIKQEANQGKLARVLVLNEEWSCVAKDGQELKLGQAVEVERIDGTKLIVRPL